MRRSPMRLPTKLAFTAFHVAVAGTLACSAKTDNTTEPVVTDAASDVAMEAAVDAAPDVADAATKDAAMRDGAPMEASTMDAAKDAANDAASDAADECAANYYCGPAMQDASCPGYVCDLSECSLDAGCEPFV